MADVRQHKLRKYKAYLEAHPDSEEKVLQVFKKLSVLPVTFGLLKETGIGKAVNSFRKEDGEIGTQARAIVSRWKAVVASEGSTDAGSKASEASPSSTASSSHDHQTAAEELSRHSLNAESLSPAPSSSKSSRESKTTPEPDRGKTSKPKDSNLSQSSHEQDRTKKEKTSTKQGEDRKHSSGSSKTEKHTPSSSHSHGKKDSAKECLINGDATKSAAESSVGSSKSGVEHSRRHKERRDGRKEGSSHSHQKATTQSSFDPKEDELTNSSSSSSGKHKSHSGSSRHSSSKDRKHSEERPSSSGHGKLGEASHSSQKSHSHKKESSHKPASDKHKNHEHSSKSSSGSSKKSSSKSSSKEGGASSATKKHSTKETDLSPPSKKSQSEKTSTVSSVVDEDAGSMSFEDFMNIDVAAVLTSTKKKPAVPSGKKSSEASASFTGASSSSSSSASGSTLLSLSGAKRPLARMDISLEDPLPPPKQMKFDIMSSLPETQADYRPRRFFFAEEEKKKPTVADVDPMLIGTKAKSQRRVYSGRKHGPTEVKRLYDLCMQTLMDHIDDLEDVGAVPFDILKPVMDRCTVQQLYNLEEHNPKFLEEEGGGELWKKHCERDFKKHVDRKEDMETWRELYLRLLEEREAKFEALKVNMCATVSRVTNEKRKTQMAYVDTVARAPRQIRQKQIRFGTGRVGTTGDDVMTGPVKTGFTRSKAGPSSTPTPAPPKQVRMVAPMMQKTLKMMKKLRR